MGNKLIDEILRNILKSGSSVAAETVRKKNQSSGKTVTGSKQKNVNTGSIKSGIRGISSYKLYSNNKPSSSNNTIKGNTAFNNTKNNNQGIQNNFNSISKNSNTYLKDNNIKSFNQMGFENYNNMQKQKIQSKQNQKDAINKSVSNVYKKGYDYLNKGLQNGVKVLKQKSSPIYSKSGLNGSMYNSTNSDKKVNADSIVYKGNNNINGNLSTQNPNLNKDFMNFQKLNNQNNMLGFGFNNNYIKPYAPKTGNNNNFKSKIIKNSNINNKLNLYDIKNSNIKTKIGFDDYNYYGKDILSSWGDSIESKFDLKRKTDKSDKNKTVINVKPYGIVDKSISTDVYRKKFGPGSEYSKSKIEQRNKRHEQFAPVWNNAKPMNSTKTYAEINNIPRRPGDLTKENSTNMYYEHVAKPKMQAQANKQKSQFQKDLHNFIVNTKDAPRYGDFSRRKYYAEDGTAIDPFISPKVRKETKELLEEDYGDPGAVEYMLEKKGAENLDFSNTEALKKNPVLKDVDRYLLDNMTEEERKMLYVAMSDHMAEDKTGYNDVMREKIPYAMSLVVSDRVKEETLANIEKYGNVYLLQLAYTENLYGYIDGVKQNASVMGKGYNPSYSRGQSAALSYLSKYGTYEQKMIIDTGDLMAGFTFDNTVVNIPYVGQGLSYMGTWGKEYNDELNYGEAESIKEAQDAAFFEANTGFAVGKLFKSLEVLNSMDGGDSMKEIVKNIMKGDKIEDIYDIIGPENIIKYYLEDETKNFIQYNQEK